MKKLRLQSGLGILAVVSALNSVTVTATEPNEVLDNSIVPDLTEIARHADGIVFTMAQQSADRYCKDRGLRLSTAREWALYSQSLGAKGISDTKQDWSYPVKVQNEAGQEVVDFYFHFEGYKRPTGNNESDPIRKRELDDQGKHWFWSSSVDPLYSDVALTLNGPDGEIGVFYHLFFAAGAVRCVRTR